MTIFGTSVLASFFTKGCFSSVPKTQLGNICDILLQQTSKDLQNLYWGGSKRFFFFFTSLEPNCLRHFLCVSTVLLWLNHAANSLHVVYLFVSPLPQTCSGHLVMFSGRLNLLTSASNKRNSLEFTDNLNSHASMQAVGKLLIGPITANTHFPD